MDIYTHKHHIIPRHMGGTDDPSNLVELTIEEHAQAHERLYEEHGHDQDRVAALMLRGQISNYDAYMEMVRRPKSEKWKKEKSEAMSGEGNPMYGKTISDEHKEAIRVANSVPKPYVAEAQAKLYAEGNSNLCNRIGALNGKSKAVIADGVRYDTLRSACDAYGFKNHNAGAYRIKSLKWDWRYE